MTEQTKPSQQDFEALWVIPAYKQRVQSLGKSVLPRPIAAGRMTEMLIDLGLKHLDELNLTLDPSPAPKEA